MSRLGWPTRKQRGNTHLSIDPYPFKQVIPRYAPAIYVGILFYGSLWANFFIGVSTDIIILFGAKSGSPWRRLRCGSKLGLQRSPLCMHEAFPLFFSSDSSFPLRTCACRVHFFHSWVPVGWSRATRRVFSGGQVHKCPSFSSLPTCRSLWIGAKFMGRAQARLPASPRLKGGAPGEEKKGGRR